MSAHTEHYAMGRMPQITARSFVPERDKFTPGRIARTVLLLGVAAAILTAGIFKIDNLIDLGSARIESLQQYIEWFGADMFTVMRPEVLSKLFLGLVTLPIAGVVVYAAIRKSISRANTHLDQEWYGA